MYIQFCSVRSQVHLITSELNLIRDHTMLCYYVDMHTHD